MINNTMIVLALTGLLGACAATPEAAPTTPTTTPEASEPVTADSFQSERVHAAAQVRIWVPEQWKVDDSEQDMMIMTDPNEEVSILFAVVDGDDLLGALALVAAGTLTELDAVELTGEPAEFTVNGMAGIIQDGKASVEGVAVELSVGVVFTPANKYLVIVGLAESAELAKHAATVEKIVTGLQPLEG